MSASRFSLTLSFRADAAPPPSRAATCPTASRRRSTCARGVRDVRGRRGRRSGFFPRRPLPRGNGANGLNLPPSQKAQLAKEKGAKQQNKQRFPKGKSFLDVADWLTQMEKAQVLDGDNVKRSGHTYAKNKFETKEQFDAAKGRTAAEAKAKKPGFLNW